MRTKTLVKTIAIAATVGLGSAAALPHYAPAAATDEVRLEVDISERKLFVYDNGSLRESFDVAVGEPEHPTPKGSFTIDRIIWNPAWVPPPNAEWAEDKEKQDPNDADNPMVGAKLFFEYPDYYIHGTDATHTLGQAESHGCIRMDPADIKRLAEFVQEHGGKDKSSDWYSWVKRDDDSKHEVTLPDPVPVEIHD
jgi:lipoprotein-anchoring transpeptidase ErfK/SrfK